MGNPAADHREALTVSDLTSAIRSVLQASFPSVWVCGEVSDVARPRSGHIYLTLKDDAAQIKAVIWRSDASNIRFPLEDGTEVLCRGALDLYAPRGTYQLVIRKIEPRGEGAMQKALRQLQARLAAEGLFDPARKQPLPPFPRHVALVTSPSGAAIRDFLEVARRRWCGCQLTVLPCRVQGDAAVPEIVGAIAQSHTLQPCPDVVVVTRGGGSMEDLWCFNSEKVVRAIHACPLPVISAVGHEIDVTLSDMVADVRALTPTEAAERVVPDQIEIRQRLDSTRARMLAAQRARIASALQHVRAVSSRRVIRSPLDRIHEMARRVDDLEQRLTRTARMCVHRHHDALAGLSGRLEALSPLGVLARGYSYTQSASSGAVINDADQLAVGSRIITTLATGRVSSTVDLIEQTDRQRTQPLTQGIRK